MDDAARSRLVSNVVGHLKKGVSAPVLARALDYWRNIDQEIGDRIATGVSAQEVMSSRAVRGVGTRQKGQRLLSTLSETIEPMGIERDRQHRRQRLEVGSRR
jgi:hypothetical protein